MGLFGLGRKPWKHSEARVRLRALREMPDSAQSIFAEMARSDPDADVRTQACARLQEERTLASLSEGSDERVAKIASSRLTHLRRDRLLAATGDIPDHLWAAVSGDAPALTEIACRAQALPVRQQAVERLVQIDDISPALLTRIAIQDEEGSLGTRLLTGIDRLQNLKEIAKKAKVEAVREAAEQRHAELLSEARKPGAVTLQQERHKKLEALLGEAQILARSSDWQPASERFTAIVGECEQLLAKDPEPEEGDRDLQRKIMAAQEQFVQRRQNAEAEAAAVAEAESQWEALYDKARASVSDAEDPAAAVAEFIANRGELPEIPGDRKAVWLARWDDLVPTPESTETADGDAPPAATARPSVDLTATAPEPVQKAIVEAATLEAAVEDARATDQRFKELHKQILDAGGDENERRHWLDAYFAHYNAFRDARRAHKERRAEEDAAKRETMKTLLAEAETLAAESEPEDIDGRANAVKNLQDRLKQLGRVGGSEARKLRNAIRKACDQAFAPVKTAREARDWERFGHASQAEVLIRDAEAAVEIENPEERMERIKELQRAWKGLGSLPRSRNQDLWDRFRAAGDAVFTSLQDWFAERDAERHGNYTAKRALVDEVQKLAQEDRADDGDDEEARERRQARGERVRAIQEEWKTIGPVPRELDKDLFSDWRAAQDEFFGRRRQAYEEIREEQLENLRQKQGLIAGAEELSEEAVAWKDNRRPGMSEQTLFDEMRDLRRSWRQIGFVPKEQKDTIRDKFEEALKPLQEILEPWLEARDEQQKGNLEAKQAILKEIEELLEEERPDWFLDDLKALQDKWQKIGPVPRADFREINDRYRELCDRIRGDRVDR